MEHAESRGFLDEGDVMAETSPGGPSSVPSGPSGSKPAAKSHDILGLPLWLWIVGVAGLGYLGYRWYQGRQASSSGNITTTTTSGSAPTPGANASSTIDLPGGVSYQGPPWGLGKILSTEPVSVTTPAGATYQGPGALLMQFIDGQGGSGSGSGSGGSSGSGSGGSSGGGSGGAVSTSQIAGAGGSGSTGLAQVGISQAEKDAAAHTALMQKLQTEPTNQAVSTWYNSSPTSPQQEAYRAAWLKNPLTAPAEYAAIEGLNPGGQINSGGSSASSAISTPYEPAASTTPASSGSSAMRNALNAWYASDPTGAKQVAYHNEVVAAMRKG